MTSDRIITDRARRAIPVDCEPFLPIMETAKSTEMIVSEGPHTTFGKRSSKERIVTVVVLAVALIFLIVGIVLIAVAANDQKNEKSSRSTSKQEQEKKTTECEFSEEAKRVEFGEFFDRVKATYFKLHPYHVYRDLACVAGGMRERARPPYFSRAKPARNFRAAKPRVKFTRLFTNPLTASPLAFTALLPKQKHSCTKSRQLRRLIGIQK